MFVPVSTIEDLAGLDDDAIVEGYREGLRASPDEPEPGLNRGRAFWHGWCNAMRDRCIFPPTRPLSHWRASISPHATNSPPANRQARVSRTAGVADATIGWFSRRPA